MTRQESAPHSYIRHDSDQQKVAVLSASDVDVRLKSMKRGTIFRLSSSGGPECTMKRGDKIWPMTVETIRTWLFLDVFDGDFIQVVA